MSDSASTIVFWINILFIAFGGVEVYTLYVSVNGLDGCSDKLCVYMSAASVMGIMLGFSTLSRLKLSMRASKWNWVDVLIAILVLSWSSFGIYIISGIHRSDCEPQLFNWGLTLIVVHFSFSVLFMMIFIVTTITNLMYYGTTNPTDEQLDAYSQARQAKRSGRGKLPVDNSAYKA
jgi:hypothetical protein